jgi:signal transduction histidine kinase
MKGWPAAAARRTLGLLWPRGLGGRAILVLLAAVVLVHLGTMLLYHDGDAGQADAVFAGQVAGRLATAARVVADTPAPQRDARAHGLSSPGLDLHWGDHAAAGVAAGSMALPNFRRRLMELAPDLGEVAVQFGPAGTAGAAPLNGSVRLADGTFLNFGPMLVQAMPPWTIRSTLLSTTLMAGGVVAVAAMLLRSLTRPLRRLAAAADRIGRGPDVAVAETGPDEVRHLARAFNGMQARIHGLLRDRTQALAAVSHDLRTPITRLRLRAGFLADPEAQAAMDADLEEMEGMIEATLAYLRGDAETEPRQVVDLAALLSTITDAVCDAGGDATYAGPHHVAVALHPSAIRRAFANLVSNAVTYGGSAHVTVVPEEAGVTVRVDDAGPGIPEADLDRVFQPFQRLEASRNRGTGGVGLGLAIARQAVGNEGGTVRLGNRRDGGLRAEVFLPCAATTPHAPAPWAAHGASHEGA